MNNRQPLEPLKIRPLDSEPTDGSARPTTESLPPLRRPVEKKAPEKKIIPPRKEASPKVSIAEAKTETVKPAAPRVRKTEEKSPRRTLPSVRPSRRLRNWFLFCLALLVLVTGAAVGAGIGYINNFLDQLPTHPYLEDYQPYMPSRMWDKSGRGGSLMFAEFFSNQQSREMVTLTEMPKNLINAVICTEDQDFYDHFGISVRGVIRAAYVDIITWSKKQGASTLTMQLAEDLIKNKYINLKKVIEKTYIPMEGDEIDLKSWKQKIVEAILALQIEKRYTKNEILEIYLNQVYFGKGALGVGKAAQVYFGKNIKDLTLKECALFAAMLKRPGTYSPYINPDRAESRTRVVLGEMLEQGAITQEEYRQALSEPFQLADHSGPMENTDLFPYYSWAIRRQFENQSVKSRYGNQIEVIGQGVDVETALYPELQQIAQETLRKGIIEQERFHRRNGGELYGMEKIGAPNALVKGSLKADGMEYDAQLLEDFDPAKGTVRVTVPNVGGGNGPFEVAVDPATTWMDDFDVLKKGYYIRVKAVEEDGKLNVVLGKNKHVQGALIAVRPSTGEVLALSGGYDFHDDSNDGKFIRAIQSTQVQPGSTFKPLLYTAALAHPDKIWTVASRIQDVETQFWKGWTPQNYEGHFNGNVTMRFSLLHSLNSGSVWLLDNLSQKSRSASVAYFRQYCREVFDYLIPQPNLSMALGTEGMSPWQLAQAYQVIANQGIFIPIHMVKSVYERRENPLLAQKLFEFEPKLSDSQRITPEVSYLSQYLLRAVVEEGTAKDALDLPFYNVGKTGTTDNCVYAWYAGFSKDMLCIVYFGYDDNRHSLGVKRTGSKVALPVWTDFMTQAYELYPEWYGDIPAPEGVITKPICQKSRQVAGASCGGDVRNMPFIAGTEPKGSCQIHGGNYTPTAYQYEPNKTILGQYGRIYQPKPQTTE